MAKDLLPLLSSTYSQQQIGGAGLPLQYTQIGDYDIYG